MTNPPDLSHVPGIVVPGLAPPRRFPLTDGYWAAADEKRLVIQRCADCGAHRHPPGPVCYRCQSAEWSWAEMDGIGTVYSYTWVEAPLSSAFADVVPFNVCVIELDGTAGEPVRLVSTVTGLDRNAEPIGMRVRAFFAQVHDTDHHLLLFAPE